MSKIVGKIGFATYEETAPSAYVSKIIEKQYYMDLERFTVQNQNSSNVNADVNVSNTISILADNFTTNNLPFIKYVWFKGAKWNVASIEVLYPRLRLTLGGLYNGEHGPKSSN